MSFSYDPSTPLGRVRRAIADTVEFKPAPNDTVRAYIFDDAELADELTTAQGSVRYAAASALRAIAASRARMAQVIQSLDVKVDTRQLSTELLAAAKALEEAEENLGYVAVAEMAPGVFGRHERLEKERERRGC